MSKAICRDCKRTAPAVTIPKISIIEGYGHCQGCLVAPSCEACGRHAVADKVAIHQGVVNLCSECRQMMGITIIQVPTPKKATTQATKAQARKVRKPARMAS